DGLLRFPFTLFDHAARFRFCLSGSAGDAVLLFTDGGGGTFGRGDDFARGRADGFAGVDYGVFKRIGRIHAFSPSEDVSARAHDTRKTRKATGGKTPDPMEMGAKLPVYCTRTDEMRLFQVWPPW